MDIDRYFQMGPASPVEAHDIFVNRDLQIRAVRERLTRHSARAWPMGQLLDFQRPTHNLVTFAGDGGVGKSALARHSVRLAVAGEFDGAPTNRAGAVVDFADPSNHDFASVLLRLRAMWSELGADWPAFDIAFAVYWERKHPGRPLAAILDDSASGARGLGQEIGQMADGLLGGSGLLGLVYRTAETLGRNATQSLRLRRLRQSIPVLDVILREEDPDKMLGYMPVLLAADLERLRGRTPSLALCLLDTFEVVQALPPKRGGLEDLVSRLVYLTPNVLYIGSGRRPFRWHDPVRAVGLTYGGERRWPGLAGGDQIGLFGFDGTSAELFLTARLTVEGRPAIPAEIRRRIINASAGSPLYLELASSLYEEQVARGEQPAADAFGQPFPELVLRLVRDMSAEERDLLRTAALVGAYDADLIHAVLPGSRGRTVEAFLQRPFHRVDPSVWPAYRLHESLRQAVNECDEFTSDGWTSAERGRYARVAVAHLADQTRGLWRAAADGPPSGGRLSSRAVPAFLLALDAAATHGLAPPELGEMVYTLRQLGYLRVLGATTGRGNAGQAELDRLVEVIHVGSREQGTQQEVYEEMLRAADDFRSSPYADYIHFELGLRSQNFNALDASDRHFAAVGDASEVIARGSAVRRAANAVRRSVFPDAMAALRRIDAQGPDRAQVALLVGDCLLLNGSFEAAGRQFEVALRQAESDDAPRQAGIAMRMLARAAAWHDPGRSLRWIARTRDLTESIGDREGLARLDASAAVAHTLAGDWDAAAGMLERARDRFVELGLFGRVATVEHFEVFLHAACGRLDEARHTAARLAGGEVACMPVWAAVCALWTGQPHIVDFSAIAWLDSVAETKDRWLEPLTRARR
ncbi:hypothetical protein [Yinghuangia sp. YIM S09857]|uniref:hypothetical protein n=1 Tax=Yinghuangia sp. YIM S09857 TaxID=3436929 RepID=UPI003F52C122